MNAPICPHCGQPDEENIWLARQLPQGQKAYLYCGRCGGGYYLIKTTSTREAKAIDFLHQVLKAVDFLHRVMGYYIGDFNGSDEIRELLNEIEAFLTETEVEKRR